MNRRATPFYHTFSKGMFMNTQEIVSRSAAAAEEFDRHEHRSDGSRVLESLCGGLTLIRDAVYARVHADVERRMGMDSMIFPLSEEKSERTTKLEIEIYQIVVTSGAAEAKGYVSDGKWFRDWLAEFRMGRIDGDSRAARRMTYYVSKSAGDQRLAFGNILATALPEASRAPLVLLRLVPAAVQIAVALAFGKSAMPSSGGTSRPRSCPRSPIAATAAASSWRTASNARRAATRSGPTTG